MSDGAAPTRPTWRLAGVPIRIECADPRLLRHLEPWLELFLGDDEAEGAADEAAEAARAAADDAGAGAAPAPAAGLRIAFELVPAAAPPPADLEPLVEYYYVTGYRRGALTHFRTAEGGWLELDAATGEARGALPRRMLDGPPWPLRDLFNAALTTFLRARGRYPLHGAALHHAAGGALIVGSAMAGKTTLSLALARRGWRWIADDKILLRHAGPGAPAAAGLLGHANIDPSLVRWFPELAGLEARPPVFAHTTKRAVRLRELRAAGDDERPPRGTTPRWLIFPSVLDAGPTRVEPLGVEAAFLELVRQSPLVNDRRDGRAHLDLLGRLARHARAFRLLSGRDFLEDPERLAALGAAMELPLEAATPRAPLEPAPVTAPA